MRVKVFWFHSSSRRTAYMIQWQFEKTKSKKHRFKSSFWPTVHCKKNVHYLQNKWGKSRWSIIISGNGLSPSLARDLESALSHGLALCRAPSLCPAGRHVGGLALSDGLVRAVCSCVRSPPPACVSGSRLRACHSHAAGKVRKKERVSNAVRVYLINLPALSQTLVSFLAVYCLHTQHQECTYLYSNTYESWIRPIRNVFWWCSGIADTNTNRTSSKMPPV